jgi:sulfur-carrier protein
VADGIVLVRFYAAARAAAGVAEEKVGPGITTLATLVAELGDRHGTDLTRVLARCSYLIDEVAAHGPESELPGGCTVDVLPPFAGGADTVSPGHGWFAPICPIR